MISDCVSLTYFDGQFLEGCVTVSVIYFVCRVLRCSMISDCVSLTYFDGQFLEGCVTVCL